MIKAHIISKDGASELNLYNMNKNGRQTATRSEDLIVADVPNCIGKDGQPLERIEFDISEVKGWSSINVANFKHDFLVARVRGICAVIIKKEQDSKTRKLLANPRANDNGTKAKYDELTKLLNSAYDRPDEFDKIWKQREQLKKDLTSLYL